MNSQSVVMDVIVNELVRLRREVGACSTQNDWALAMAVLGGAQHMARRVAGATPGCDWNEIERRVQEAVLVPPGWSWRRD